MDKRPPRTRWLDAVMNSTLPPTVRHVLHVMSTFSDNNAKPVYPSQEGIAKKAGLKRETVSKQIKKAVTAGFLSCDESGGPGKKRLTNLYSFHIPRQVNVTNDHMNNTSYSSSTNNYKDRDVYVTKDHTDPLAEFDVVVSPSDSVSSASGLLVIKDHIDQQNRDQEIDPLDEFNVISDHMNTLKDSKERISSNSSFTSKEDVHVTVDHSVSIYAGMMASPDFQDIRKMVVERVAYPYELFGSDEWTDELICKAYDFHATLIMKYGDIFSQLTNQDRQQMREDFYLSVGMRAEEYAKHVLPI